MLTAGSGLQMLSGGFSLFLLQSSFFYWTWLKLGSQKREVKFHFTLLQPFLGGQFVQFNWTWNETEARLQVWERTFKRLGLWEKADLQIVPVAAKELYTLKKGFLLWILHVFMFESLFQICNNSFRCLWEVMAYLVPALDGKIKPFPQQSPCL